MRRTRKALGAFVCVLFLLALTKGEIPQSATRQTLEPVGSGAPSNRPVTAEDLLRALRSARPTSDVISPVSRSKRGPVANEQTLLPEGTAIVDRPGFLKAVDSGWEFQPTEGSAMSVLPNGQLEAMVAIQNVARDDIPFLVSAEVTVFAGKNYLLIKQMKRSQSPTSRPKETVQEGTVATDASAVDVLQALQAQRPDKDPRQEDSLSGTPSSGTGAALEGTLMVRKSGRLVPDGSRWRFRFDDKQAAGVDSITILPNQALELMVQAYQMGGATGLAFIVSGETTEFGADSFLLVRGVTRIQDTGNLRP